MGRGRTSIKSIAGEENDGCRPAWVRLTKAGSVTDGRGDRQGLHREGFSPVEGQGEVWMTAGGLVPVLNGGAQDEDKHKAPSLPLCGPLSLRQPNDYPDPNLTPIGQPCGSAL